MIHQHDPSEDNRRLVLFEQAQESLPDYGLEGGTLTLLQDLVNTSFQVRHESGCWYLRIYATDRQHTEITSEMTWMAALAAAGFPVPRPLQAKDSGLVTAVPSPVSGKQCLIAGSSWIEDESTIRKEQFMASIQSTRYVIAVHDLEQSARFYRDVLGFQVRTIEDDGWLFFEKDLCIIMAGRCEDAIAPKDLGDHRYFAYICIDQIDAYFQQVQERGARILKKPRDEPWGMREFAVETADGHRIMFAAKGSDK